MFERRVEGPEDRVGGLAAEEYRRAARRGMLGTGTLACPSCDVPVVLARAVSPAAALACPYCGHAGAVRDFLSLAAPSRPARVTVRVRLTR